MKEYPRISHAVIALALLATITSGGVVGAQRGQSAIVIGNGRVMDPVQWSAPTTTRHEPEAQSLAWFENDWVEATPDNAPRVLRARSEFGAPIPDVKGF
jgi:hypothetical protein